MSADVTVRVDVETRARLRETAARMSTATKQYVSMGDVVRAYLDMDENDEPERQFLCDYVG